MSLENNKTTPLLVALIIMERTIGKRPHHPVELFLVDAAVTVSWHTLSDKSFQVKTSV